MEEEAINNLPDNFEAGPTNPTLCGICWQQYSKEIFVPVTLQCGHTFCRKCLRILGSRRGYGSFHCATCRMKVYADPKQLPKNFQLVEVLKKFNLLREDPEVDEEIENEGNQPEHNLDDIVGAIHDGDFAFDFADPGPNLQALFRQQVMLRRRHEQLANGGAQNQVNEQNVEVAAQNQVDVEHPQGEPMMVEDQPAPNQLEHEGQPAPNANGAPNQVPTIDPPSPEVMQGIVARCESLIEMIGLMRPVFDELRQYVQNFQGNVQQFRIHMRNINHSLLGLVDHPAYHEVRRLYHQQQLILNPQLNAQVLPRGMAFRTVQPGERRHGIHQAHPRGVLIGARAVEEIRLQRILMAQFQQAAGGGNQENAANANNGGPAAPNNDPAALNQDVARVNAAELMEIMQALATADEDAAANGGAEHEDDEDDHESLDTVLEIGVPRVAPDEDAMMSDESVEDEEGEGSLDGDLSSFDE